MNYYKDIPQVKQMVAFLEDYQDRKEKEGLVPNIQLLVDELNASISEGEKEDEEPKVEMIDHDEYDSRVDDKNPF